MWGSWCGEEREGQRGELEKGERRMSYGSNSGCFLSRFGECVRHKQRGSAKGA
jgi:hypothetical protein